MKVADRASKPSDHLKRRYTFWRRRTAKGQHAMIRVRNLTKYYGDRRAVDNISFHIEDGEIVGFLGPNGAGKTTTLRILTCYMPATSGSASVAGHDVFTESLAVRRVLGYLPENVPMYPDMRAR